MHVLLALTPVGFALEFTGLWWYARSAGCGCPKPEGTDVFICSHGAWRFGRDRWKRLRKARAEKILVHRMREGFARHDEEGVH